MDTQSFGTGLRYVDAEELRQSDAGLMVGVEIRDRRDEKIGELDGFVVDANAGQPKYAVVDAGGWFKSERFLLPIAHLAMTSDGSCTVDIDKAAISNYPAFDEGDWMRASADERWDFEYQTLAACCPGDASVVTATEKASGYDRWQHYREPSWWRSRAAVDLNAENLDASAAGDPSSNFGGRAQPGDVIGKGLRAERQRATPTS